VKRGGGRRVLAIDSVEDVAPAGDVVDLVALDDALDRLAAIDARQASIVEMRYFGGMTIEEVATALDMGKRSVDREWQCARIWLYAALSGDASNDEVTT
jgi:RNA polymerase sigma-70 factor (ECF subfamily)